MKKLMLISCAGIALTLAGCSTYNHQGAPANDYETVYGSSAEQMRSPSGLGPQYRDFDTLNRNPMPPLEATPYPSTRTPGSLDYYNAPVPYRPPAAAGPGSPMDFYPPVALPPASR